MSKSEDHDNDDDDDQLHTRFTGSAARVHGNGPRPWDASPSVSLLLLARKPRWLYLTSFTWISVLGGRFAAPFLHDACHLTVRQVGLSLALQMAVATVLGSLGGVLADAHERRQPGRGRALYMAGGTLVGTLAFLGHAWATQVWQHVVLRCLFAAATVGVFPVLDGLTLDHLAKQQEWQHELQPCANDASSTTINNDSSNSSSQDYGKERLYGAIGWALTNVLLGWLLDRYGFAICYPLAVLTGCSFLLTLLLYTTSIGSLEKPLQRRHKHQLFKHHQIDLDQNSDDDDDQDDANAQAQQQESSTTSTVDASTRDGLCKEGKSKQEQTDATDDKNHETRSVYSLMRLLLGHSYGWAFFVTVVCLSSGQAVVDSLIFLFFGSDLDSSFTVMGWTVVLTVAFEIPIFQIAPKLLQRWGPGRLLVVAAASYVVRVLGYTLLPNGHVLYVLLLEPLHGVTYACSQTAVVDHVARVMPASYEATGQGLVYLSRGVGSGLGLWLGGWAEQVLGARRMYRLSALVVLVGTLGLAVELLMQGSEGAQRPDGGGHEPIPQGDLELTVRDDDDESMQASDCTKGTESSMLI